MSAGSDHSWPVFIRKYFLSTTVASMVPVVFIWAFSSQLTWHQAWINFQFSFIYSQSIGGLLWFSLPSLWRATRNPAFPIVWLLRFTVIIVLCALGSLIGGLVAVLLHLSNSNWADYWPIFRQNVRLAILMGTTAGAGTAVMESMRDRLERTKLQLRTEELGRERALKQVTEAKLASLESRIHPHFLFNTINSVSSLIHEDPDRAERVLERMAALLRFSLDSEQNGLVPLDREMKIVNDYLEIERTRFGDRLRFSIDQALGLANIGVPPLSIQTLVENSVKFAVATRREGGAIRVTIRTSGNLLNVDVWDDGPSFSLNSLPSGHGLDNLQSRLTTLFSGSASLSMIDADQGFTGKTVRMQVPASALVQGAA